MFVLQFASNLKNTVCIHLFTDIRTYVYICTFYYIYVYTVGAYVYVICFIQDPPPINDVTASTSRIPSDLSGYDIFIMWTVSGLCTCGCIAVYKILYIVVWQYAVHNNCTVCVL